MDSCLRIGLVLIAAESGPESQEPQRLSVGKQSRRNQETPISSLSDILDFRVIHHFLTTFDRLRPGSRLSRNPRRCQKVAFMPFCEKAEKVAILPLCAKVEKVAKRLFSGLVQRAEMSGISAFSATTSRTFRYPRGVFPHFLPLSHIQAVESWCSCHFLPGCATVTAVTVTVCSAQARVIVASCTRAVLGGHTVVMRGAAVVYPGVV